MSFLNDLYESIGTERPPPPPVNPKSSSGADSNRSSTELTKPVGKLAIKGAVVPQNGIKRTADEMSYNKSTNVGNPVPSLAPAKKARLAGTPDAVSTISSLSNGTSKPLPARSGTSRVSSTLSSNTNSKTASTNTNDAASLKASSAVSKAPPKNFQEILARAKQAQAERPQSQIGMIKHQPVSKEKVSRLAEKRRGEEDKLKHRGNQSRIVPRQASTGRIEKRRSASPAKRQDLIGAKKKEAKPATSVPVPGYRGTMGLSANGSKTTSSRSRDRVRTAKRTSRYDDYLDTDEEDEGDMMDDDEPDNYQSDVSSDMEAGALDIDEEEDQALRVAKEDDAKEAELELKLKGEKEERRKKLQALANKSVRKY